MNIETNIKLNNSLKKLKECNISKEDADIICGYIIELEEEYNKLYKINQNEIIKKKLLKATYSGSKWEEKI